MGSAPLRIMHCVATVYSGGVERRRLSLAQELDPAEFQQIVVCTDARGPLPDAFASCGVAVVPLGCDERLSARKLTKLCAVAREFRPDIVHGAVFEGVITGMVAATAAGARFLAEETSYATNRSWRGHLLFHLLSRRAAKCIAVSPAVARLAHERTRIPSEKIVTILNGVAKPHSSLSREAARVRLGVPPDAFVVMSLGRMVRGAGKRFDDLIRAVAMSHESVVLAIGGDGELERELRSLAVDLQVADRVFFCGFIADVGDFLRAADVFALVSERESFGLALGEAMLLGIPSIATKVGGMVDLIVQDKTGIHVDVGAPSQIRDGIERLRRDPLLRSRLGTAAKAYAERTISVERYAREVAGLYRSIGRKQSD